jgi:hypothetical protein
MMFFKINLVTFLFDSSLKTRRYNQPSFCPISKCNGSDALVLQWKNPAIFRGGSIDYGPKSIWGSEWNFFGIR